MTSKTRLCCISVDFFSLLQGELENRIEQTFFFLFRNNNSLISLSFIALLGISHTEEMNEASKVDRSGLIQRADNRPASCVVSLLSERREKKIPCGRSSKKIRQILAEKQTTMTVNGKTNKKKYERITIYLLVDPTNIIPDGFSLFLRLSQGIFTRIRQASKRERARMRENDEMILGRRQLKRSRFGPEVESGERDQRESSRKM